MTGYTLNGGTIFCIIIALYFLIVGDWESALTVAVIFFGVEGAAIIWRHLK